MIDPLGLIGIFIGISYMMGHDPFARIIDDLDYLWDDERESRTHGDILRTREEGHPRSPPPPAPAIKISIKWSGFKPVSDPGEATHRIYTSSSQRAGPMVFARVCAVCRSSAVTHAAQRGDQYGFLCDLCAGRAMMEAGADVIG